VGLMHSRRLSLMKGAHADVSGAAWQEIRVKPYYGLSGITALDARCYEGRTREVSVQRLWFAAA
jgi:hypothetical protein